MGDILSIKILGRIKHKNSVFTRPTAMQFLRTKKTLDIRHKKRAQMNRPLENMVIFPATRTLIAILACDINPDEPQPG